MLTSKIIENKNFFTKPNGDIIVDLTKSGIEFTSYVDFKNIVVVTDDFVMRPDLIADAKYNNPDAFDLILKYNGISNPFGIYEHQILLIPDIVAISKLLKKPKDENTKEEEDTYYDNKDKRLNAPIDINRVKFLNNIEKIKKKKHTPPNVNDTNRDNVEVDEDTITFGDVITDNNEKCETHSTKAKVKESILSKRMKDFLKIKDYKNVNENKQSVQTNDTFR